MTDIKKPNIIEIDDGTKEYTIVNKYGQTICAIHFRAGDMSIVERMKELQEAIPEITKDLENVDIKNDGSGVDMDGYTVIREAEKRMAEALGKVFDTEEVSKIFEKRSMFSSVNGEFFVTQVVDVLVDQILETMKEENEKTAKRIEKYMKKNHK